MSFVRYIPSSKNVLSPSVKIDVRACGCLAGRDLPGPAATRTANFAGNHRARGGHQAPGGQREQTERHEQRAAEPETQFAGHDSANTETTTARPPCSNPTDSHCSGSGARLVSVGRRLRTPPEVASNGGVRRTGSSGSKANSAHVKNPTPTPSADRRPTRCRICTSMGKRPRSKTSARRLATRCSPTIAPLIAPTSPSASAWMR